MPTIRPFSTLTRTHVPPLITLIGNDSGKTGKTVHLSPWNTIPVHARLSTISHQQKNEIAAKTAISPACRIAISYAPIIPAISPAISVTITIPLTRAYSPIQGPQPRTPISAARIPAISPAISQGSPPRYPAHNPAIFPASHKCSPASIKKSATFRQKRQYPIPTLCQPYKTKIAAKTAKRISGHIIGHCLALFRHSSATHRPLSGHTPGYCATLIPAAEKRKAAKFPSSPKHHHPQNENSGKTGKKIGHTSGHTFGHIARRTAPSLQGKGVGG